MRKMGLYRGKRIDTREWVHGYLLKDDRGCFIIQDWTEYNFNNSDLRCSGFAVDSETVGEFSGETLRGRDLYEGDIVDKENNHPRRMMIAFIEGAFCLAAVDEIRDDETGRVQFEKGEYVMGIHYIHHAGREQAEIVGTIHDEAKP